MIIGYGFDSVVRSALGRDIFPIHRQVKKNLKDGNEVIIVTKRKKEDIHFGLDGEGVLRYVRRKFGDIPVVFTEGRWKWEVLEDEGVDEFHDDWQEELDKIMEFTNIKTHLIEYDKSQTRAMSLEKPLKKYGKDTKVCILDNGSYVAWAIFLAKYFDIYYYSRWENEFPVKAPTNIGIGIEGVTRVNEYLKDYQKYDIFIFPDIYFRDVCEHFRDLGKATFGSGEGETLERDRIFFKNCLKDVGLLVGKYKEVLGIDNLKELFKKVKNVFVKISEFRGEMETKRHINIGMSDLWLDERSYFLGTDKNKLNFIVEDAIDSISEFGCDLFTVNGEYPSVGIWGIEDKDWGYICTATEYDNFPEPIKMVNKKISSKLKELKYVGWYSNEIRYTEKKESFFTDITMRLGQPSGNCQMMLYSNWDEIIGGAVQGVMVMPKVKAKYAVELVLKCNHDGYNDTPISFPKEYEENIKLKGCYKDNGKWYIIPFKKLGHDMSEIGSVVTIGDDLEKTIDKAKEIAKSIECEDLLFDESSSTSETIETIENLKNLGFKF